MKNFFIAVLVCLILNSVSSRGQDFSPDLIPFAPNNEIDFKLNLPIVHLDVNNYVPSIRGLYAGQNVAFKFYCRNSPWTNVALFMRVRWDTDLDASNGITWSDWFEDEREDAFATVIKNYSAPGNYTVTFEIEFVLADGSQSYSRQKQYDITVAPPPTAIYVDSHHNQLYYWAGADGVCDKPVFLVEGFDPDNSNPPEVNYGLGFDLIQQARSTGYDLFIMEWADGGADIAANKDVFLGACQFIHSQLNGREAAVQVVGISMGGTVARYGLAWAEDNSPSLHPGKYIEHYVNTFISFDAPQQGGHVNSDLQKFIRDNGNAQQQAVLRSSAAKQMLYEDVYENDHDAFYATLRSLHNDDPSSMNTNGYPRRCRNFAVSNGNRDSDYPNFTTSTQLATLRIYVNLNIDNILTLPATQQTKYIFAQDRDLWPGSTFPHDLTQTYSAGYKFIPSLGLALLLTQAFASWQFEVNFNPSYTPTESALDLDGYTRGTGGALSGGTSWFDETFMQTTFHRHEELTTGSKTTVMNWLNSNLTAPYLGRPGNAAAVAISSRQILLTFTDEAAFEQGFRIERKTANGSFTEIAALATNTSQYIDYCVSPAVSYSYRIRSYSGNSYSPYSTEAAVTTPAAAGIPAPGNLSATGQPGYISIAWNAVPGATGYKVYRNNADQPCPDFSFVMNTNSYLDIPTGAAQSYTYQVTGLNGSGEGAASNGANASTLHLASQSFSALSGNNQRKFIEGMSYGFRTQYVTYESGGASFLTWSSDGGNTWSSEAPIGGYPSVPRTYKNPTLALDGDGITADVLYDLVAIDGGTHSLVFGQYSFSSNSVNALASLDAVRAPASYDLLPSAVWTTPATNMPSLLAYVYRLNTTSGVLKGFGIGTFYRPPPMGPSFSFSNFDLTDALHGFPAVAPTSMTIATTLRNEGGMKYAFYVVWAEDGPGGGIKFARGLYAWQFPLNAGNIVWDNSASYSIAANTATEINTNPTIAIDGSGNVFIAWEYRKTSSPEQGNIKTVVKSGGYAWLQPLSSYTFPNDPGTANYPFAPSIADYRKSISKSNDLSLTWFVNNDTRGGLYYAEYTAARQAWSSSVLVDPQGRQASIQSTSIIDHVIPRAVYVKTDGPPFAVATLDLPYQEALLPAPPMLSWSPVVSGSVSHPKLIWTQPAANISSYRLYRYYSTLGDNDGGGGDLIYHGTDNFYTDPAVNVGGKNFVSRAIYYVVAFDNGGEASPPSGEVSVATANIVWKTTPVHAEREMPAETKLTTNYPNPFNPLTKFEYQIAEPGKVRLSVYNELGEEIETIVDEYREAGYYTAEWNAGSAPTGIYFARMFVSDKTGKVLYQSTKRLLLMK